MNGCLRGAALALLATLIAGCDSPEDTGRTAFGPKPLFDPVKLPTSSQVVVPLPFDGLYGQDADPNDEDPSNPVDRDDNLDGTLSLAGVVPAPGLGLADGWSTTAPLFLNLTGDIDVANAADGIRIFDSQRQRELQPGVDFLVTRSPVSAQSPRLLVHWLRPLDESTRYLVGITSDLKGPDGGAAIPNELFQRLRCEELFSTQDGPEPTGDPDENICQTRNTIVAALRAGDPAAQTKIATLDGLQQGLILPVIDGLAALSAAVPSSRGVIGRDDLALAWSFTTQSITPTLAGLAADAEARDLQVGPTGATTMQLLSQQAGAPVELPPGGNADVFVGRFDLAYFHAPGAENIQTSVWANDGTVNNVTHPGLGAPCGALGRPVSTTICYPDPAQRADLDVPVLATKPMGEMPAGGWPVVVFLHGITGNRSQMLGISPALTQAGFVVVAIDQPLHGLPPGHPLRVPGTTERTFDADLVNNETGAPGADGEVDPSGQHFVNLASVMTGRDNLRQSIADQTSLIASLENLVFPPGGETVNTDRVYFVGHSLGGIVGGGVLGVNPAERLGAATLAMPGGGIVKLLDGSDTFGPRIAAGLEAAAGLMKGTDSYEIFLRFAQLAVDPADPVNFAAAAAARGEPIHLIEVAGDSVVPNSVVGTPNVVIDGYLSGTQPLAEALGLEQRNIDPPLAAPEVLTDGGYIRFAAGNHGSILQPTGPDDPVFTEMQRQTANFLASDGQCLPLGGNCPTAQ